MNSRDRVHDAIAARVEDAAKVADGLGDNELEARLTLIVDGWGRGLAAGLEELAVAVDELRRLLPTAPE